MFRLKKGERVKGRCAAVECKQPSTTTDASGKHWEGEVQLCDGHWDLRCEIEDQEDQQVD